MTPRMTPRRPFRLLAAALLALLAGATAAPAATQFYPAVALTGGGTGALDKISGAGLNDRDVAIVVLKGHATYGNAVLFYVLSATSGAAESVPNVIAPDVSAGTKRWLLTQVWAGNVSPGADGSHYAQVTNTNDATTTGWGSAERGRFWFNLTLGKWRVWNGSAVADMSVP